MSTTRRTFLTQAALAGTALVRPVPSIAQDRLPTRGIPGVAERLPIVGFGSTKAVLGIPDAGIEPVRSVIRTLLDGGGRVMDTAPRPAAIDAVFGRLLQQPGMGDELFLAVKVNATGRDEGLDQLRQTQRLFGQRTLDLVQIESLTDAATQWPTLREWKDTAAARYIGVTVSNTSLHERLETFMRRHRPDFIHVNYSVTEPQAEERILPLAMESGTAVLTNRPFMNGSYFQRVGNRPLPQWAAEFDCTSWAQFSLKYILAHPAVTCALTETTNPAHMAENMGTAYGRFPAERVKRRMRETVG